MEWKNSSESEREYPITIIEKIMEAFLKTSNGLLQLELHEIRKLLFRKFSGLSTVFQYRLRLSSKHVERYSYNLFTFGFEADFEEIEVIVNEDIFKEISDNPSAKKPFFLIKNRDFIKFLESVFNAKKFTSTVYGLTKMAEKNKI